MVQARLRSHNHKTLFLTHYGEYNFYLIKEKCNARISFIYTI